MYGHVYKVYGVYIGVSKGQECICVCTVMYMCVRGINARKVEWSVHGHICTVMYMC